MATELFHAVTFGEGITIFRVIDVRRRRLVIDRYGEEIEEIDGTLLGYRVRGQGRYEIRDGPSAKIFSSDKLTDLVDDEYLFLPNERRAVQSSDDETSDERTAFGWRHR